MSSTQPLAQALFDHRSSIGFGLSCHLIELAQPRPEHRRQEREHHHPGSAVGDAAEERVQTPGRALGQLLPGLGAQARQVLAEARRSEEHMSELQSPYVISY